MANTDVINLIIQTAASYITYMLPVLGILAGLTFIFSMLYAVTLGFGRKAFKG